MKTKRSRNRKYESIAKRILLIKNIDSNLKKVLTEIFLRRAEVLELSEEEFKQELRSFSIRIGNVRFAGASEFNTGKEHEILICGKYVPLKREIIINRDGLAELFYKFDLNISQISEEMFEIFTHEVFHTMAHKTVNPRGVGLREYKKRKTFGVALDEIFNERMANRCTINLTDGNSEYYNSITNGYTNITFVSSIIAATFGKTEKETLKAASNGRKSLMECLLRDIPSQERGRNVFDSIELNLDLLYQLQYKIGRSSDRKENKIFNQEEVKSLRAQTLEKIYTVAIKEVTDQVREYEKKVESKEFIASRIYNSQKIMHIFRQTIGSYKKQNLITEQDAENLQKAINKLFYEFTNSLSGFVITDEIYEKQKNIF